MLDRVKNLANLMRLKKEDGGEKFVLMLGAGASMSSGVPSTPTIINELLASYGRGNGAESVDKRFDALWGSATDETRRAFLKPYLDRQPSVGYAKLAELMKAGYLDVVLSFNFDNLLESALDAAGGCEVKRVIRGETIDERMQTLLDAREPRIKLFKLHGSLSSANYFLFNADEMYEYPLAVDALVRNLTARDLIVCGYSFNDLCVLRAFSKVGGAIYSVNPGGVPRNLTPVLKNRRSEDNEILADFDTFFTALHDELLRPAAPPPGRPPRNPFKFLESYDVSDAASFTGRDDDVGNFFKFLGWKRAPHVIVIAGPGKAGKTSLVRAGLLPRLDAQQHQGIYLRCRPDIEASVPAELARRGLVPEGLALGDALRALGDGSPDRRVILLLDQFERVTSQFDSRTRQGKRELGDYVSAKLLSGAHDNLTIVLVVTDDGVLGATLAQECGNRELANGTIVCAPFGRTEVVEIMRTVAADAGFDFDARIIEEMADSFEQTKSSATPATRFTLAHIHAVCHVLASRQRVTYEAYKGTFDRQNLDVLHQAINVSEFTTFVEDCCYPDSAWLRNMLKVLLRESKERIAEFIKVNYDDELRPRREPAGAGAAR